MYDSWSSNKYFLRLALFIMKFHWGLRGAAVATVIGQFVAFLCMTTYFFSSRNHLKLNFEKLNCYNI